MAFKNIRGTHSRPKPKPSHPENKRPAKGWQWAGILPAKRKRVKRKGA